jgi:hypothetical protein
VPQARRGRDPGPAQRRRDRGVAGGFDPGSNTVVYQQFTSGGSDLYLFDLDTGTRTSLGGVVSTARWEWNPEISDTFILFGRWIARRNEQRILLYNRTDDSITQLDVADVDRSVVAFPGSVGERYATWTRCNKRTCLALYYDSQTGIASRIPSVDGRPQYAPAIDEATEQVYFVRSGFRCGRQVRVLRAPLAALGTTTVLFSLPRGIATEVEMSLAPNPVAGTDLWFGRYRCRANDGDVYVARDIGSV